MKKVLLEKLIGKKNINEQNKKNLEKYINLYFSDCKGHSSEEKDICKNYEKYIDGIFEEQLKQEEERKQQEQQQREQERKQQEEQQEEQERKQREKTIPQEQSTVSNMANLGKEFSQKSGNELLTLLKI